MIEFNCPCCGQSMGPVKDPADIPMSPVSKTILRTLPATIEQIAAEVYGTRDNVPDSQYQSLRTIISRMRKRMAPHGWTINDEMSGRGGVKTYRLVRLP